MKMIKKNRKSYFLYVMVLVIIFAGTPATASPYSDWIRTYNRGPGDTDDYSKDIAVDSLQDIYVIAACEKTPGSPPDYVIVKYDPLGNILWSRSYDKATDMDIPYAVCIDWMDIFTGPSNLTDWGYAIAIDDADHVYVAGATENRNNQHDILLVKYSP